MRDLVSITNDPHAVHPISDPLCDGIGDGPIRRLRPFFEFGPFALGQFKRDGLLLRSIPRPEAL